MSRRAPLDFTGPTLFSYPSSCSPRLNQSLAKGVTRQVRPSGIRHFRGGFSAIRSHQTREYSNSQHLQRPRRIVVAVIGATGSPLAVALLQRLRQLGVETYLILSKWGSATLKYELEGPNNTPQYFGSLVSRTYSPLDVSAPISSGSFRTDGMIVVPCSMKTLAGIRMGYDSDLIVRAASVTLKERRRLVVVVRETPLSSIHLENMLGLAQAGAVVFPPVVAFYTRPKSIQDLVDQSVTRMVDLLGLELEEHDEDGARWDGFNWEGKQRESVAG